jgi:hypothetical protein
VETTNVEARYSADGRITPLSFTWRGESQPITSYGRQWGDEENLHFLVMTSGDLVFELVFVTFSGKWQIARAPSGMPSA